MRSYLPLLAAIFGLLSGGCQTPCGTPGWGNVSSWSPCGSCQACQQPTCGPQCGYNCQGNGNFQGINFQQAIQNRFRVNPCESASYPGKYEQIKDDLVVKMSAKRCARSALNNMPAECRYSHDFRSGFERAYHDIAKGGEGVTPAVPPEVYWKASYRTERGHRKAEEWFAGYRAGSEMARGQGLPDYNYIPTSFSSGNFGHSADGYGQCQTCNSE